MVCAQVSQVTLSTMWLLFAWPKRTDVSRVWNLNMMRCLSTAWRMSIVIAVYWLASFIIDYCSIATSVSAADKSSLRIIEFFAAAIWIPFALGLFVLDWIAFQRRWLMHTYCRVCGRVCENLRDPKCENCGEHI